MKKQSYFLFIALCIMNVLLACENEEAKPLQSVLTFECQYPLTPTRATEAGFELNDRIGVFLTTGDKSLNITENLYSNIPITYNGTNWDAGFTMYWNEGLYNVFAYYPYITKVASYTDYPFSVNTDQSTAENYAASDFLWAKTVGVNAGNEPVKLQFSHRMSKLLIQVKPAEGTLPNDAEVYVHSTIVEATINLNTGSVSKQSQVNAQTIRARKIDDNTYAAYIVPQRLDDAIVPLVEVVANGVSNLYEGRFVFKPGVCHTITVKI